jgi:hypothetical protein
VATGRALTGIPVLEAAAAVAPVARTAVAPCGPRSPRPPAPALAPLGTPRRLGRAVTGAVAALLLLAAGATAAVVLTGSSDRPPTSSAPQPATTGATGTSIQTQTVERTVTARTAPTQPVTTTSAPLPTPRPPRPQAVRERRFTTGQDAGQTTLAAACAVSAAQLKC